MTSWKEQLRRSPETTNIVAEGGPWGGSYKNEVIRRTTASEGRSDRQAWSLSLSTGAHFPSTGQWGSAVVKAELFRQAGGRSSGVSYLAARQLHTQTSRDFKAGTLESGDVDGSSFQGSTGLQGTSPVGHTQSVLVTEKNGRTTKLQQSPHRGEDGGGLRLASSGGRW